MARYGFFLGINPYQDPNIGALKCAENDARELAGVFQHKLGFQTRYIEERDATGILNKLENFENELQPGDTFLFYFSGHGIQHAKEQYFLLPKARLTHLDAGDTTDTLPWKTLNLRTSNNHWAGVNRIFMFDACRAELGNKKSGGVLPSFKGEAILRKPVLAASKANAASAAQYPLTVINSCRDGQCAVELIDAKTDTGKGSFTEALLGEVNETINAGLPFEISQNSLIRIGNRIRQRTRDFGLGDHEQSPMVVGVEPVIISGIQPPLMQQNVIAATQSQPDVREHQWKLLLVDVELGTDVEEKIRLLRAYISDPHCAHMDEAIKMLRELQTKRTVTADIDPSRQKFVPTSRWDLESHISKMASFNEKIDFLKSYMESGDVLMADAGQIMKELLVAPKSASARKNGRDTGVHVVNENCTIYNQNF